jgi:molybdopterin/thiamine biosynthesis adenylyltransferase
MVGAGALGCEFLKNFALMGIATGAAGLVTLTDDDSIEKSNLSRQFLFRNSDVGKSKSDAAATAAKKMNGAIKLKPMQDRVSPNTENVFNDEFWKGLSLVCNALDNIQARLYVDRRCVFFNKALLESGTLGTKCNTQVVIPNLTENYGASRDPEEKMTPDCVPEDHEILTNRGFMDLDTYLANRDDESLLVASFDVATQALVFERPLGAVVKERAVHRMVEFTSSKEARHTWADTAGEYGRVLSESPKRAADERSNGVSVLVTRGHEMYVQHGDWSIRDGRKQQSAVPYEKVKASTLVDSDADTFNAVRQMAVAPAGVAQPAAPLPFAAQLRLDTPARAERFLELYGFWLGHGSAQSGRIESVRFAQVKPDDLAFLRESFVLLGVNYSEDKPNSKGEVAMYVRDVAWVQLFAAEHGQDSPKCFAAWVWSLDTASVRVVLRGLRRADGSRAADEKAIYTSSARFRDEIVRVCLMAGYTARFRCHNRAGQINGNGKPAVATWRVVFAEPDSISGKTECFPTLFKERGELAACKFEGRVWCFTMPSGFVWVRRAHKNAAGVVTKASRPLLLGNCTLHNFPHNIQHCLSYSRSEFIGQFTDRPSQAADWADAASPEAFLATLRAAGGANGEIAQTVEGLKGFVGALPSTFAECVAWARLLFDEYFVRKVRQLTHLYPADATTKSGLPFWSPPKRFPVAEEFNADDELHLLFIQSAAALRAVTSGINVPDAERRNLAHVKELVSKVVLAPWAPSDNIKIKLDEKNGGEPDNAAAAAAPDSTDEAQLLAALRALPSGAALAARTFQAQEFEKDDATNFHMDFIHAGANLRARNYKIKGVDALQSKLIAGRIIPAIATTTASATGLVCLELYKQVQAKKLEAFRNAFVNLALPVFQLIEPMPPAKIKSRTERRRPDPINHPDYVEEEEVVAYPDPHTVWDHLVVDEGDITVQEFIDFFAKKHSWTVNSIALPVIVDKKETAAMVYNSFTASTKARLPQKFSAVYEKMSKVPLGDRKYFIPSVLLEDDDGKTIETPEIIFVFRK